MAFRSTLDLYSSLVLPRLADGPKTLEQLDVPQHAVEHLRAHGLIKPRCFRVRSAVQVWFLPEDLAALQQAEDLSRFDYRDEAPASLLRCDELRPDDWPPDDFRSHGAGILAAVLLIALVLYVLAAVAACLWYRRRGEAAVLVALFVAACWYVTP